METNDNGNDDDDHNDDDDYDDYDGVIMVEALTLTVMNVV